MKIIAKTDLPQHGLKQVPHSTGLSRGEEYCGKPGDAPEGGSCPNSKLKNTVHKKAGQKGPACI